MRTLVVKKNAVARILCKRCLNTAVNNCYIWKQRKCESHQSRRQKCNNNNILKSFLRERNFTFLNYFACYKGHLRLNSIELTKIYLLQVFNKDLTADINKCIWHSKKTLFIFRHIKFCSSKVFCFEAPLIDGSQ